jgi:hypothetical protein
LEVTVLYKAILAIVAVFCIAYAVTDKHGWVMLVGTACLFLLGGRHLRVHISHSASEYDAAHGQAQKRSKAA